VFLLKANSVWDQIRICATLVIYPCFIKTGGIIDAVQLFPSSSVICMQFLLTSTPPHRYLTFRLCECPPVEYLDIKVHKALKLSSDVWAPKDQTVDLS